MNARFITALLLMSSFHLGCGSAAQDQEEPAPAASASEQAVPAASPVETNPNQPSTPPMSSTPAASASVLDPAGVNPDEPIPVGALHATYFSWKDQPVVVGGYFKLGNAKRGKLTRRITLAGAPGIEVVDCEVTNPSGERVTTDQPLIVKGTYTHFSTATRDGQPQLQLKECEVVSVGEPFAEGTEAVLGQTQPIPVEKLHEAITGWQGKEVTVVGYYHSSGYSSATGKTKINLRTERRGKTLVGCHIPGKDVTPENLADNREGVVMRGTVGEPTWDMVLLEDCVFVNR